MFNPTIFVTFFLFHITLVMRIFCATALFFLYCLAVPYCFAQQQKPDDTKISFLLSLAEKYLNNEPISAMKYAREAMDSAVVEENRALQADALHLLGLSYSNLGEYEAALRFLLDALKIYEYDLHNLQKATNVYNDIATIYRYQLNPEKAIFYLEKAIQLEQQTKDEKAIATTYNQMGRVYTLRKQYDKALEYHKMALAIREKIKDSAGLTVSYNNVGYVLIKSKKYQAAIQFLEKSLLINQNVKNYELKAGTLDNIGDAYKFLNKPQQALEFLQKGLQQANNVGAKNRILESYESLVQYYEWQRNFETAFSFQQKYLRLKNSLFDATKSEQIAKMTALYNFEQQRVENEKLKGEHLQQIERMKLQEATLRLQGGLLLAAGLVLVLAFIAIYSLYYYNKKKTEHNTLLQHLNKSIQEQKEELVVQTEELNEANEEIKQLNEGLENIVKERTALLEATNKELDTFLYRTSHDFRRPITALQGLVQIAYMAVNDTEALTLFEKVKQIAKELDNMLHKLRQLSEIRTAFQKEQVVDFESIIESQYQRYSYHQDFGAITWLKDIRLQQPVVKEVLLIEHILENLIENAVAFRNPTKAWIKITVWQENEQLILEIRDNGRGISPELQCKIFDMYFRGHEDAKGNGLGLYVVKCIVQYLKGRIWVESEIDKGTTFTVALPL